MSKRAFKEIISQIAAMDLTVESLGDSDSPETKAYQAARAELVEALDQERGTADATYEQFRAAFDAGFDCDVLFEIRNRMHPHDELKAAANQDLRSVGCYSPTHRRSDASGAG